MAMTDVNPIVSTVKPSDAPLTVKLHPLVLLTITDYISRHSLTQKEGPIIGAVIGQQDGRLITLEHAFESAVKSDSLNDGVERVLVNEPWFGSRLKQYKEVHKDPQLELVAAFTLGPASGPLPEHVPFIQQLKAEYNDDVKLLLFHPETVLDGSMVGGKLPITLWESFYEPGTENADKGLQVDGWGIGTQLQLKFRQIPFEVETGEAEMIAVDYVAKGAANANLATDAGRKQSVTSSKGKGKAVQALSDEQVLSAEDEELISSLTSKANAIKMLHSRLNLITTYLSTLPPSYLSDPSLPPSVEGPNHVLLRQVNSLLSRLPLLSPPSSDANNTSSPNSDVELVTLLSTLTASIASVRDLSTKSSVVSRARVDKRMAGMARGADLGPELMEGDTSGSRRGGRSKWLPGRDDGLRSGRLPGHGHDNGTMDTGFDSGADGGEY
ncbi:hypothetical protein K461DRAFT_295955 [Myriangium duriaei CBS 260.36]|uniref:COP9 signalosome complex subunit 6 n=1 Tax=Myriangium duriaei CBS 260.36 TaxID=1168546 RepID=A0A9P4MI71_9PEZI|nr:hypothetical protein K461DRAFT_295955 [Myriangium duriaei CBS 260.36]